MPGEAGDVEVIGDSPEEEELKGSSGVLDAEESSAEPGDAGFESYSSSGVAGIESVSFWSDIV